MDQQPSRIDRFWQFWAALSLRRPVLVALAGTVLFAVSLPGAIHLYGDLRTDLRELLPQGAPAAVASRSWRSASAGSPTSRSSCETDDLKAGERFVDAVAKRLMAPAAVLGLASALPGRRGPRFLDAHGALYADLKDLVAARDALKARRRRRIR